MLLASSGGSPGQKALSTSPGTAKVRKQRNSSGTILASQVLNSYFTERRALLQLFKFILMLGVQTTWLCLQYKEIELLHVVNDKAHLRC